MCFWQEQAPPGDKWERATADSAGASRTWGLRDCALRTLGEEPSRAVLEVQSRLAKLYPEYDIVHMPAEHMQPDSGSTRDSRADDGLGHQCCATGDERIAAGYGSIEWQERIQHRCGAGQNVSAHGSFGQTDRQSSVSHLEADVPPSAAAAAAGNCQPKEEGASAGQQNSAGVYCAQFVGNAPVAGDQFSYHVDADPAEVQDSRWTAAFGRFCNGEPGRPLLVSALLYLCAEWRRDWAAETLFLDTEV